MASDTNKLRWHFPDLDHGQADGLNDPLVETFEGNHEYYIARETIQNSVDARLDPKRPVRVIFERFEIPAEDLPGAAELRERMKQCLKETPEGMSETREYFEKALGILGKDKMHVLRIRDLNTLGLNGEDEDKTGRWYRLVKAVGLNQMTGVGGGSFGIGKGAPIAASPVRTVFYSSMDENGDRVFQGKAMLVSHTYDGKERRGTGFFGVDGYKAIRAEGIIPKHFSRPERGTDVYVAGYEENGGDWREALATSILENFWMAIHDGDLQVSLLDARYKPFEITSESLFELLQKYSAEDALSYYRTVIKPDIHKEVSLPLLGTCRLYLRREENFPKRVALMRKAKMIVKKKQFRIMQDAWAGVFICDDERGNKILRDMEPPQHDEWNPDRDSDRARGKQVIDEIYAWIKEGLREMAQADSGDPEEIPGLDQFLPYEDEDEATRGETKLEPSAEASEEETALEVGRERTEEEQEVESVVTSSSRLKSAAGAGAGITRGGGSGSGEGESSGGSEGEGAKALERINTANVKFRTFAVPGAKGASEYCLIIEPLSAQKGAINMLEIGDDANYPAELSYAKDWSSNKPLRTSGSFITDLGLKKGEKLKLRLGTASKHKHALGVESYES
jgi:hypothetical protein